MDPSAGHLLKMVRSIMVKGLEALTAECAIAAIEADVLDEVFVSLSEAIPTSIYQLMLCTT